MRKSILFVRPDYHTCFFYRDALTKKGWRADIYVPHGYPEKLLYSRKNTIKVPVVPKILKPFVHGYFLVKFLVRYDVFFMYGTEELLRIVPQKLERVFGRTFKLDLFLMKLFGKRLVYQPSGCVDIDLKENITKYDNGNICENCGWGSYCDNEANRNKFHILKKYYDKFVGYTDMKSTKYEQTIIPYKVIDLKLWSPNLDIPEEFRLPPTKNLRILHSFYNANRQEGGKNIKGSPYIIEAIERLKEEGYAVEYMYITDVPSRHMRYYQAQADIVVEQLIYGWWGSTGVETMALGKPVICYLREDAKENFFRHFPEYDSLPIIEANTQNIYEVLKKTVEDKEFRERKAKESREFAERFFDVEKNVEILEKFIMSMPGNSR